MGVVGWGLLMCAWIILLGGMWFCLLYNIFVLRRRADVRMKKRASLKRAGLKPPSCGSNSFYFLLIQQGLSIRYLVIPGAGGFQVDSFQNEVEYYQFKPPKYLENIGLLRRLSTSSTQQNYYLYLLTTTPLRRSKKSLNQILLISLCLSRSQMIMFTIINSLTEREGLKWYLMRSQAARRRCLLWERAREER